MRGWILAGFLAASPALADTPQGAKPSGQAGERAPPQSVWKVEAGGDAEHLQSGLKCPLAVDGFRQAGLTTYDGFGLDVSCGYNSRTAAITVYLSRGFVLDQAYGEAKDAVMRSYEARRPALVAESTSQRGPFAFRLAQFTLDGGALRSDIWMTDLHGWVLKYRVSYPERDAGEASAALDRLTAMIQDSAAARLSLCAKSKVPERPGKAAKAAGPSGADAMMSSLLLAAADVDDEKPKEVTPIIFCVEEPLQVRDMHFLAWRGVEPDGSDAEVDQLTGMTVGPPPTLTIARNGTASLILAELTRKGSDRWTATVTQGRKTTIFGHFERRPAGKLTADLMARILSGKARSLGGYDAESKTVTVVTPK